MGNYSVKKSTMERYDVKIEGEDAWRCRWAKISISDDGILQAQTDRGDFSHYWGSPGKSFKDFLIGIFRNDTSYLYGKIARSEEEGKVNVEKTVDNMKRKVVESRKEARNGWLCKDDLTKEEARDLWDSLEMMGRNYSEITSDAFSTLFYHDLPERERRKVFSDEWWYDDIIVSTRDEGAKAFCDVVAPIFAEILQLEMEEAKKNADSIR